MLAFLVGAYVIGTALTIFINKTVIDSHLVRVNSTKHYLLMFTIWLLSPLVFIGFVFVTIGYLIETKICKRR